MMKEESTSVFYVASFEKKGSPYLVEDCELSGVGLGLLRKIFNIDPNHSDIMVRDMVYNLEINEKEAMLLKQYISFNFDFHKYNYYLQQYSIQDDGSTSDKK